MIFLRFLDQNLTIAGTSPYIGTIRQCFLSAGAGYLGVVSGSRFGRAILRVYQFHHLHSKVILVSLFEW
jgi:hypothetical protein